MGPWPRMATIQMGDQPPRIPRTGSKGPGTALFCCAAGVASRILALGANAVVVCGRNREYPQRESRAPERRASARAHRGGLRRTRFGLVKLRRAPHECGKGPSLDADTKFADFVAAQAGVYDAALR